MSGKPFGSIRLRFIALGFVGALAAVFFATSALGRRYAAEKAEELVSATDEDVDITVNDFYAVRLLDEARAAVRLIGAPGAYSHEKMREIAAVYAVDEVNIADGSGRWIASTEDPLPTIPLADKPETAAYLPLLDGRAEAVAGPFRPSVCTPSIRAKFVAVPFPGGNALLQLGVYETTVGATASEFFNRMMTDWNFGNTGFIAYSEKDADRLVAGPWTNRFACTGVSFEEFGLDAKLVGAAEKRVVAANLDGRRVWMKARRFAGRLIFVVLPYGEYQDIRLLLTFVPVTLLAAVFAVLILVIRKVRAAEAAEERLREVERKRLEGDLRLAAEIQHHSLPHRFPPYPDLADRIDLFAAMRPARDVGGDFYDFRRISGDRLLITIADVSGKGIPAAMFMMRAKVTLMGECSGRVGLDKAVASANRQLCQGDGDMMFVTAWVGLVDLPTGRLSYVNAGHNPPVVRHADGSVSFLDGSPDLPLAAMDETDYGLHETRLAAGDVLFAYTDGVTEAADPSGAFFGDARLKAVVAESDGDARSVCDKMFAEVAGFASGASQSDDITMLALRLTSVVKGDALGLLSRRKFNLSDKGGKK